MARANDKPRDANRRDFVRNVLALVGTGLAGSGCDRRARPNRPSPIGDYDDPTAGGGGGTLAYRLSVRGKRASRASKLNAANKLFATKKAAQAGRAHPGERSRIVAVYIHPKKYQHYFQYSDVVDLRYVPHSTPPPQFD
jgi:hypothetical protein